MGAGLMFCACSTRAPTGSTEADRREEARLECESQSTDLFAQRILPLLVDDRPKSCNQCHLSGIDLGLFVRKDPCETMACLVEEGLVDLESPEKSIVLGWIRRASPESELITEEVLEAEYSAFYEWIEQEATCETCSESRCGTGEEAPFCDVAPEPEIAFSGTTKNTGCSDLAIEELFFETVYQSRGRCYPCHFDGAQEYDIGAPPWAVQSANCKASSLGTLRNIIKSGYINVEEPEQSLLILKPLMQEQGGVEHGGHDKFELNDSAHSNFLQFVTRYAECQIQQP